MRINHRNLITLHQNTPHWCSYVHVDVTSFFYIGDKGKKEAVLKLKINRIYDKYLNSLEERCCR
jgi:hypothetical protein